MHNPQVQIALITAAVTILTLLIGKMKERSARSRRREASKQEQEKDGRDDARDGVTSDRQQRVTTKDKR